MTDALKQHVGTRQGGSDAFLTLVPSPNKTYVLTTNDVLGISQDRGSLCTYLLLFLHSNAVPIPIFLAYQGMQT